MKYLTVWLTGPNKRVCKSKYPNSNQSLAWFRNYGAAKYGKQMLMYIHSSSSKAGYFTIEYQILN
jgi:hypothetical protein